MEVFVRSASRVAMRRVWWCGLDQVHAALQRNTWYFRLPFEPERHWTSVADSRLTIFAIYDIGRSRSAARRRPWLRFHSHTTLLKYHDNLHYAPRSVVGQIFMATGTLLEAMHYHELINGYWWVRSNRVQVVQ